MLWIWLAGLALLQPLLFQLLGTTQAVNLVLVATHSYQFIREGHSCKGINLVKIPSKYDFCFMIECSE